MTARYSIERTSDTVYQDERGQAIKGKLVLVRLPDYDELHELTLPNINPATVKKAAEKLVSDRDLLAGLGSESTKK